MNYKHMSKPKLTELLEDAQSRCEQLEEALRVQRRYADRLTERGSTVYRGHAAAGRPICVASGGGNSVDVYEQNDLIVGALVYLDDRLAGGVGLVPAEAVLQELEEANGQVYE